MTSYPKGRDVSSYQGNAANMFVGLDFAFVKATQGVNYVNPFQAAQVAQARAAGAVVGLYHYVVPGDMRAQAQYFAANCVSVAGDMLALDWEGRDAEGHPSVSCADKDEFLTALRQLRPTNHRIGLYCNKDFWLNVDTTSNCGDFLWIAAPSSPVGDPGITHPWTFQQYSISPEDLDVANFADKAALVAWAVDAPPKAPTPVQLTAAPGGKVVGSAVVSADGTVTATVTDPETAAKLSTPPVVEAVPHVDTPVDAPVVITASDTGTLVDATPVTVVGKVLVTTYSDGSFTAVSA